MKNDKSTICTNNYIDYISNYTSYIRNSKFKWHQIYTRNNGYGLSDNKYDLVNPDNQYTGQDFLELNK